MEDKEVVKSANQGDLEGEWKTTNGCGWTC